MTGDLSAERTVERTLGHLRAIDTGSFPVPQAQQAPLTLEDLYRTHRMRLAAVGYLRTAVVNGSRSVLRRRRTAREYTPPHQVNARSAESLAMLTAEHQSVVRALSQLPPRQREVLVLRYYGDLTEAEIAEAAGISKGTVKSTASRALDALQKIMRTPN
ncbi:MAG: sigma-70 family RNA polymerase sigma factor [Pseudonocardiaceae bacterium]|nr:sigma-70 family RNA polymerase sigma factor [Pseudonocardiaceae bacterium]